MTRLTILYDGHCGFCVRCRQWLEHQPKYLDLEFLATDDPEVLRRYPQLQRGGPTDELIAIDDQGGVYRDHSAWLICLWALVRFRAWSYRLSGPLLRPLARRAFALVSSHRLAASRLLGMSTDEETMLKEIRAMPEPELCRPDAGTCTTAEGVQSQTG